MILTCPSCGTRYVVKDGAIPAGGRTVRCAQCKHSWHQDPQSSPEGMEDETPLANGGAAVVEQPGTGVPEGAEDDRFVDHAYPEDTVAEAEAEAETEAEEEPAGRGFANVTDDGWNTADTIPPEPTATGDPSYRDPAPSHLGIDEEQEVAEVRTSHPLRAARMEADDPYSPFAMGDEEDDAPPRRWLTTVLGGLLLIAIVAAALWFLAPPELMSRLGLAQGAKEQLELKVDEASRQQLASGNQLFEVSGQVINPTDEVRAVPPIQAQLRSLDQEVVYRWTIPPPAVQLGPGERVDINSSNLDVPSSAACLEIYFGDPPERAKPCVKTGAIEAAGA